MYETTHSLFRQLAREVERTSTQLIIFFLSFYYTIHGNSARKNSLVVFRLPPITVFDSTLLLHFAAWVGVFEITGRRDVEEAQVSHFLPLVTTCLRPPSTDPQTAANTESHPGNSAVAIVASCYYKCLEHILQKVWKPPCTPRSIPPDRKNKQTLTVPIAAPQVSFLQASRRLNLSEASFYLFTTPLPVANITSQGLTKGECSSALNSRE